MAFSNIPSLKLMDSGLARFGSYAKRMDAERHLLDIFSAEGAQVEIQNDGSYLFDFSDIWTWKRIAAQLEAESTPGLWSVRFQEGNAPTRLSGILIGLICLLIILSLGILLPTLWAILGIIITLLLGFYFYFSPEKACQERMERIIARLHQSN